MTTPTLLPELDNDLRWAQIKKKANETKAVKAFDLLRAANVEPILLKGLAAAANYPPDRFRDSIDLDLAVASKDVAPAMEVICSPEAAGLAVDLHEELRHLDTVPWNHLFERSRLLDLGIGKVRVLSPEDHLRILCVHWLTDGGANKDRLLDIHYAIENRSSEFDWDLVLGPIPPRRRRWIECAVGMSSKTFGTALTSTPLAGVADRVPKWMIGSIEKEWFDPVKFRPLSDSMQDWSTFRNQAKKRFPPNPVTATILQDGDLDSRSRIFYQLGTTAKRALPSLAKICSNLWRMLAWRKPAS